MCKTGVDMSDKKVPSISSAAVSAKEMPLSTPHDVPVETLNHYVRSALLNDPDVIEHLLGLSDLRERWKSNPNHGKMCTASLSGEVIPAVADYPGSDPAPLTINVVADYRERRRYENALEGSPLVRRGVFSAGGLDRQVSIVRERRDMESGSGVEWWAGLTPVNDLGAGDGRRKTRKANRRSLDAIELAIAAVVREINPDREPRALAEAHPGTVRTNLHRLRQLALG